MVRDVVFALPGGLKNGGKILDKLYGQCCLLAEGKIAKEISGAITPLVSASAFPLGPCVSLSL